MMRSVNVKLSFQVDSQQLSISHTNLHLGISNGTLSMFPGQYLQMKIFNKNAMIRDEEAYIECV